MENFIKIFKTKPSLKVSSSGRVNLIGEHIDYCGGKVLPVSINLSSKVYSKINNTNYINLAFKDKKEVVVLDINKLETYQNLALGNYQAGVFYVLQKMGFKLLGLDMYFDCDVPFCSGLSSSAAIEVSTMISMLIQTEQNMSLKDVSILCKKAENVYCKVNCGIMDQFASANGKKNKAMLLDCKTIECSYIPCDFKNYTLLVANCNKPRSLITSKYNERRNEVEEALKLIKTKKDIECLADLNIKDFDEIAYLLKGNILKRASHIIHETNRVKRAVEVLSKGDIVEFGSLLNESHYSLRDNYEVTGKELDTLTDLMRANSKCIGARMTGAGLGGCAICLVEKDYEQQLTKNVVIDYEKLIGYKPTFYNISIEDAVKVEKINN